MSARPHFQKQNHMTKLLNRISTETTYFALEYITILSAANTNFLHCYDAVRLSELWAGGLTTFFLN